MSSKIVGSAILALVLLQAGVAHAQASSSDAAIAQSLFEDGRKLMSEKKYAEACPRLERSYKLDPAAGTLLNLAVCHEAQGKTATAWNEFMDSISMARRENRDDRLKFAQAHVDALKGHICKLTVKQAAQEPGLEWKIDGNKMGTESLGVALPIDPGNHTVEAVAPGKAPWKTTVEFRKDGEAQSLEIPALVALPPEVSEGPPTGPAVQKPKPLSPWIFVAAGVGVAGFGTMAAGGIVAMSKWNERQGACGIGGDPNACTQAGIDADGSARTAAIVADIGLGVGVAGTVLTVIAVLARGKSKEAPARVSFTPVVTPRSAGLAFGGAF